MSLIDTSALIEMIRKGTFVEGSISIITLIEILRGVYPKKRSKVKKLLEKVYDVLTIDNKVIEKYCQLYDELKSKGELIPDADLIIASTAIAYNKTLITKDKRHFEKLVKFGLKIEYYEP